MVGLTRSIPPMKARDCSSIKSLLMLFICMYSSIKCVTYVEAAASEALLGGQYVPTTDVGYIEDLTELIEAISAESNATKGRAFYTKFTPDSTFSLESISSASSSILNTTTNPLYALYLLGYYRSANGNGYDSTTYSRSEMKFLDYPVDYYGHTIITDEFNKPSGYNPALNAETIQVTNMWMAAVQSMYDAMNLCHVGPDDLDTLRYVSPVDKAAAFYFGTHEDEMSTEGGSLYAWVGRTEERFNGITTTREFRVNDEMKTGLITLQETLADCLRAWDEEVTDEQEYEMEKLVNDLTGRMTVPLVQNLIYWANEVAKVEEADTNTVDYMILYALVTLPPLRACDASSFDTLYSNFVTNAAAMNTTILTQSLTILFNNFTCLGVTCEQIGIPDDIVVPMSITLPACNDPPMNLVLAGYQGVYDRMLESAVVDLDVLTIGALLEMDANEAAKNVYWWNKFGLSLSQTMDDVSLTDMAQQFNHEKNTVAQAYDSEYELDDLVVSVILKTGEFATASGVERRGIAETLLATVVLPIYALDQMYTAVDVCNIGQVQKAAAEWDKAVASLVGFSEGPFPGGSDGGALFYDIGQFLCANADTCTDVEVNTLIINALSNGNDQLLNSECTVAEEHIYEIEMLMETVLVDAVAFYANRILAGSTDDIDLAKGYAYATALYPLVQFDASEADTILMNSLGTFGSADAGYMESVVDALKTYVERHNGIDCNLIHNIACEEFVSATSSTAFSSVWAVFTASPGMSNTYYPTYPPTATPSPSVVSGGTYYPTYLPSSTARPTVSGVLDGGVVAISDGTVSSPLYSGAYTPTSNIDHIINLVALLDEIEKPGTSKEAALAFYTQEVEAGLSLQSLSTSSSWDYVTDINPLQIIYMYGLWISGDGDNDSNGYSNKKFNDADIAQYGNSIIMDGFNKKSGFDEKLTAETIRVTNVWMAMVTELYKAVESCRDGSASDTEPGFNPVDHAAAFWFGSSRDGDGNYGGSLYAWTYRAGTNFVNQSAGVNLEMITALTDLQKEYAKCKDLSLTEASEVAEDMSKDVLYITRLMTVPLVQNFITDLATKSGKSVNERDYLILYSLVLLPQLSICDEDALDKLFEDLVLNNSGFDGSKFGDTLKLIQDRYICLGIHCSLIGTSTFADSSWPSCVDTTDSSFISNMAGLEPLSKASTELKKIDIDVSTILSFLVMESNDAAWDIYVNGRNVVDENGSYVSLRSLKLPKHPSVVAIYNKFNSDYGVNYLALTESAIQGKGDFASTTPLENSGAASLALATIDLHLAILENLYQAAKSCRDENDSFVGRAFLDRAAALTIGWAEGQEGSGSSTDGYLFFEVAQESCKVFSTCDENGNSPINKKLIQAFGNADGIISAKTCDKMDEEIEIIETYLQAIIVDIFAYHINSIKQGGTHYLLAHVAAYAILPFMRTLDNASADVVEQNLGTFPPSVQPDIDAVYSAVKSYVDIKNIDCNLLSSSICDGVTISNVEEDSVSVPNDSGLTLAGGEYTPFTDVSELLGLSVMMANVCNAQDSATAKSFYTTDDGTTGFSLQSLSLTAGEVMSREVLFNQYVYSFIDDVDKTNGKLLFDELPAEQYSNTIISDAIDDNLQLGCLSVKVLSMWMWVVHKLNDAIEECKEGDASKYGSIDKAAAFWIGDTSANNNGGLLYALAEQMGEQFSHKDAGDEYMTTLNREIISRLNLAQTTYFVNNGRCTTDSNAVKELRKLVKETISYMTALLIQGFIHSMLGAYPLLVSYMFHPAFLIFFHLVKENNNKKEAWVELYSFAFLPHFARCGHEDLKDSLYSDLVVGTYHESQTPDIIDALHKQLNCLGLKCEDIGRHVLADDTYPLCDDDFNLLSYKLVNATKTNMPARLDLDAVAIHQLMSVEKYDIAKEVYLNGLNYYDYDDETKFGFVSLHNMTQSDTIGDTDFAAYQLYTEYLSKTPGDFADDFILSALDKTDKFEKATPKQRELAVTTAIKSFVSFMSAQEALNLAVYSCKDNTQRAQNAWDGGAALMMGSIQSLNAANQTSDGRMFFSISDGHCDHFDTCTQDGSTVTDDMLDLLTQGQGFIKDSLCDDSYDTLQKILQNSIISLVQNAIYYAEESVDEDTLAAGYIAAMAVLPWVNEIDGDVASVIKKDMRMQPSAADGEADAVLESFKSFLTHPLSEIDCEKVSNVHQLCDDAEVPASVNLDEPSILSDGLYTASNYVIDRSTISLDIRDIEKKIQSDDVHGALELYIDGSNSPIYSSIGQLTGKRSVSMFSTDAAKNMKKNPVYNRYLFGLSDRSQEFQGRSVTSYADSIILGLLYSENRQQQLAAPNAMVVLNIWMLVVQKMYSALSACKSGEGDPSLFVDEAAAYWIGDSQDTGSSTQGHLLYSMTEFIGQKYEALSKEAQSDINTRVIDLFNQAKSHLTLTNSCSTSPTSHLKLRNIIDELIPLMAVPLLRGLYYYLSIRDAVKTKVYALSVLPLFSTCSKSAFTELKGDLIDSDDIGDVRKELVFSKIQGMYDCLGLSCDLVGFMKLNNYTQCQESVTHDQMIGFNYEGDHESVVLHSKIDTDIRNIEAFMANGVNVFPTDVEDLFGLGYEHYQYEQYSSSNNSIKSLATSDARELVPCYASFRRYFDDDSNYADTIIANAFGKKGVFTSATTEDRKRVISFTMRYMVTFMTVLENLYTSLDLCRDTKKSEAHEALDAAAAYFAGSSEGEEDGGTYDGILLHMLANRMCVHFGTCSSSRNNSEVNEKIVSLLYAAQGEIDVGACDSLAKTVKGIENALTVPLIQSTLFAALENDLYLSGIVEAEDLLAEGYVLALSILPLIHDADSSAASDIADVMVMFPRPENIRVAANHAKVFRAIQVALPKMKGLDCSMIGEIAGVSFCPGAAVATASGTSYATSHYILTALSAATLFFI